MNIIFAGGNEFGLPTLRDLASWPGAVLSTVVTGSPRPAGRGMKTRPAPIALAAMELGLPVATYQDDNQLAALIHSCQCDYLVVCAFGHKLGRQALAAPSGSCLNIHASLLPRWRGAAPIERAILAGDKQTGISIIKMDEQIDAGAIYLSRAQPIAPEANAAEIRSELAELGARCLLECLTRINHLKAKPQPLQGITRAPKISKSEAHLNWTQPAQKLARAVRAFNPSPGAYIEHDGIRLKIMRAQVLAIQGLPGTLIPHPSNASMCFACGEAALDLLEVIPAGGRGMSGGDFLRGFRKQR